MSIVRNYVVPCAGSTCKARMMKNAAAKIAKKRRSTSKEGRGAFILSIFSLCTAALYLIYVVFRGCASMMPRSSICRSRWRLLHAVRCAANSS